MVQEPVPTPRCRRVLEDATALARSDGYLGVEHLALAMLTDPGAVPTQVVARFVDPSTIATALRELMESDEYRGLQS